MKRKILIIINVIMIIITIKLVFNIAVNSILIAKYNNGEYAEKQAKILKFWNFPQTYIANYNYGNILYKNGQYQEAIEQYEQALNGNIPKYKECNIRINYALSICETININYNSQESISNAIKTYEVAIDILTKNGCANKENNNGHNQKAEQLKQDIQREIDKLKNLQQTDENDNSDNEESKENETEEKTETIETKIQNIKENATKEQREVEDRYKNYNKEYNRKEKNW